MLLVISKPCPSSFLLYIFLVAGASTRKWFAATHYDLMIDKPTNHHTYVDSEYRERRWNHYHSVRKLGQIPLQQMQQFYSPVYFAEDFETPIDSKRTFTTGAIEQWM